MMMELLVIDKNTWNHKTVCANYLYLNYITVGKLFVLDRNTRYYIIVCKLFLLDRNTWNYIIVGKLFVLDRNTWYYITVSKLFVLDRNTWYYIIVGNLFVLDRNTWYYIALCKRNITQMKVEIKNERNSITFRFKINLNRLTYR